MNPLSQISNDPRALTAAAFVVQAIAWQYKQGLFYRLYNSSILDVRNLLQSCLQRLTLNSLCGVVRSMILMNMLSNYHKYKSDFTKLYGEDHSQTRQNLIKTIVLRWVALSFSLDHMIEVQQLLALLAIAYENKYMISDINTAFNTKTDIALAKNLYITTHNNIMFNSIFYKFLYGYQGLTLFLLLGSKSNAIGTYALIYSMLPALSLRLFQEFHIRKLPKNTYNPYGDSLRDAIQDKRLRVLFRIADAAFFVTMAAEVYGYFYNRPNFIQEMLGIKHINREMFGRVARAIWGTTMLDNLLLVPILLQINNLYKFNKVKIADHKLDINLYRHVKNAVASRLFVLIGEEWSPVIGFMLYASLFCNQLLYIKHKFNDKTEMKTEVVRCTLSLILSGIMASCIKCNLTVSVAVMVAADQILCLLDKYKDSIGTHTMIQ